MKKFFFTTCRTYSLPLIAGVICALTAANLLPEQYHHIVHGELWSGGPNLHWLINDVFMVFFFGIAAVDLVDSLRKGGALNPLNKAIAPLMATAGGVIGPIIVFFLLNAFIGSPAYLSGWGVCTATDIALAWLFAKLFFGASHPAVKFLLLLAVVDDAIGLVIIAIFYPQPGKELHLLWLILIPIAMFTAFLFYKLNIHHFLLYLLCCGTPSWFGMYQAGLHPALALIFIVPFMPKEGKLIRNPYQKGLNHRIGNSTIHTFEYRISPIVDYGLFFFGFTSAGVEFSNMTSLTFIIFLAFLLGKSSGIVSFTFLSTKMKAKLPEGMSMIDVVIVGLIGAIGLTVALFVSENAFTDTVLISSAKMGALFSILAAVPAFVTYRILHTGKHPETDATPIQGSDYDYRPKKHLLNQTPFH